MMDLSPERRAAAELEARILAAWRAAGGSRHLSEVAKVLCGDAWDFEVPPLVGGAVDVKVTPRPAESGLPPAALSEVSILEPEREGDPPLIVVALSWPWPDRQPADLPEKVKVWRDGRVKAGGA